MSSPVEHADTIVAAPELAETQADTSGKSVGALNHELERGARIGRYLVVDQLGAGAMGTVYAAYDPELDRKVALKLLRFEGDATDSDGRSRLLREAQAIARVAHPNVVAVHDVGTCLTDQVFIAMELVTGVTLGAWLQQGAHTTAEILEVFVQAGRGLAAAHAAGLVHRDFKPDNVLVGKDGRARVVDFGLVREADAPPEQVPADIETSGSRNSLLSVSLTHVGTIMGTPRYMAPEQRQRLTPDARADQYSFCVSLYEALNGSLPAVDTAPIPKQPADLIRLPNHAVPPHVRAAIRRGLATAPAARWPGMSELVAELARDPSARRRRWLVAGSGIAALGGIAVAIALAARGGHEDPCSGGAGEQLAGVWDGAQRTAIERAFTATQAPFAGAAFASVARGLDDYTSAWAHGYVDSCRATHVRHEQSVELLDLRTACLASHRAELAALIELLKRADAKLVQGAVAAVVELSPVAECGELASQQRLPADPAARRAIDAVRDETAHAKALADAGKYKDALHQAEALRTRAIALGYRPVEAEIELELAAIQHHVGDVAASHRTSVEAFAAALAGRSDEAVVKIATRIAGATPAKEVPRGEEWIAIAQAALERVGDPPTLHASLDAARGHLASVAGKHVEAAAHYEKARALRERFAPTSLELGKIYTNLEFAYDEVGNYALARAMGERAIAIEEALLGPNHPDIAQVLNNLGNVAVDEGNLDAARGYYMRALAIREQALLAGENPADLAEVVHNLGNLAFVQERYDDAIALYTRAIEGHKRSDPDGSEIALPMEGIGQVDIARQDYAAGLVQYRAALAIVEPKLGAEHPYVGDALVGIGTCTRELGRLDESEAALARALAIRQKDSRPIELGEAELELGKTLWLRGNHPRALELAKHARTLLAEDKSSAKLLAQADAWLAEH